MFYIRNGLVVGAKKVMTAEWEQKNNFADEHAVAYLSGDYCIVNK